MAYAWPGNVRELKSMLQSAVNLAQGKPIDLAHLPEHMRTLPRRGAAPAARHTGQSLRPLADVEKEHVLSVYRQLAQNKSQAAKILGLGLNTLRRKLASYGIE